MSTSSQRIVLEAIVFDEKSELIAGLFREIIRPQAVDRTFFEEIDVRSLFNHNADLVLGRRSAHTIKMWKTSDALQVEITPPETSFARDLIETLQRGDVDGASFQFSVMEGGDLWRVEDGEPVREVLDMRLWETGPVTFPAYLGSDAVVMPAAKRGSVAEAQLRQYHAVHALDYLDHRTLEVVGMEQDERELAMLRWPDGEPVARRTAEQAAREFREALHQRFGGVPVNTDGWSWSKKRGWFREDVRRSESTSQRSQDPGYNSQDPRERFRVRRLRQLHAMDQLAADQRRAEEQERAGRVERARRAQEEERLRRRNASTPRSF